MAGRKGGRSNGKPKVVAKKSRSQQQVAVNVTAATLLARHFAPVPVSDLLIFERQFPHRVRADLQRTLNDLFRADIRILQFCGIRKEYAHEGITLADCLVESRHSPAVPVPPQFEEVDIGEAEPIRCLKNGLWLLEQGENGYVVLLTQVERYGHPAGMKFEVGVVRSESCIGIADGFFKQLEEAVANAASYRGKILSLEESEHSYHGDSRGITVHKLRTVDRDQVILPHPTLELLERNVIQFVHRRPQLAKLGQSTKKGVLFYGPPGTGKTHTIHYLAGALEGHTTLLISAEQVGMLGEYMTLARLLQPSVVVMEDVDLIARNRREMHSPCEEVLLNKLLNEMDGLKEQADILFILTTNRPEELEEALASRPGRVDQAIEFPLPDAEGREKLVRLYSQGLNLADNVVAAVVERTDRVSAAFIKELMRRSAQFQLERNGDSQLELRDVEQALEEMLFRGGSLNLKLLGAAGREPE